jgi:hypothetical protein
MNRESQTRRDKRSAFPHVGITEPEHTVHRTKGGKEKVNKKLREYSDLCRIAKICGELKSLLEKTFQQGYHHGWWDCLKSVLFNISKRIANPRD